MKKVAVLIAVVSLNFVVHSSYGKTPEESWSQGTTEYKISYLYAAKRNLYEQMRNHVDDLNKLEKQYPYYGLGIQYNGISQMDIKRVFSGSAAEQCGLESGNVILKVNGKFFSNSDEFDALLNQSKSARLHVLRGETLVKLNCEKREFGKKLSQELKIKVGRWKSEFVPLAKAITSYEALATADLEYENGLLAKILRILRVRGDEELDFLYREYLHLSKLFDNKTSQQSKEMNGVLGRYSASGAK